MGRGRGRGLYRVQPPRVSRRDLGSGTKNENNKRDMKVIDKNLAPFEIHLDENNYTVQEDTGRVDKRDFSTVYKTHAYCSSMASAINKIIRLKAEEGDATVSLKQYLQRIEKTTKVVQGLFHTTIKTQL